MMRVEKVGSGETLVALGKLSLANADYKEREHLQAMIIASSDVFFGEIDEGELFVIGQERQPRPDYVGDRIDVLGLDPSGATVIVELKRDRDKLQLLQSLSYAAMIRTWTLDDFVREHAASKSLTQEVAREAIEQFLGASVETVNSRQRVILIAEHFDFEVLATAEWLAEGYGVEIKCVKIALRGDVEARYLTAETIFPASPLFEHAWKRRANNGASVPTVPAVSWDEVCERIKNADVRSLAARLGKRLLAKDLSLKYGASYIRVGGKRTLNVELRADRAYIWQERRFFGDHEFWLEQLGQAIDLQEVKGGKSLRFYLRTADECQAFLDAIPALDKKISLSATDATGVVAGLLAGRPSEV